MEKSSKQTRQIPEILKGKTFLDPKYDPAFRALFSKEDALVAFLNGILHLEGKRKIEKLEFSLANPLEFRTPEPKTVIFDIKAVTADKRHLDIEMQRAKHSFFEDRVLLYGSFLAIKGKQALENSKEFLNLSETDRSYRRYELPEIISIWICNFNVLGDGLKYRDEWGIYSKNAIERGEKNPLSDRIKYIIVDLTKFTKRFEDVESPEDIWLYLLAHLGEAKDAPGFDDPVVLRALERVRVSSASDNLLEEQVKEMLDQDEINCRIAGGIIQGREEGRKEGRKEGLEEGRKEGLVEGREKGRVEGKFELLKELRDDGVPMSILMKRSGLSEEEIKKL